MKKNSFILLFSIFTLTLQANKMDSLKAYKFLKLGKEYYKKKLLDSSEYFLEKADINFNKLNDLEGLKAVKIKQSNIQKKLGDYNEAIKLMLQVDSLNKLSYNEKTAVSVHNNLGIIAQYQKNYETAIGYYKNILTLKPKKKYLAIAYSNLSGAYMSLDKQDSALHYALLSLKVREEENINTGKSVLFNNLGAIYKEKGELEKAKTWFKKSLEIAIRTKNVSDKIIALNNIGNLDVDLENYIEGEKNLLEAEKLLFENYNLKTKLYNAKHLNKLYSKTNNLKKAYQYLSVYSSLKDSVTNLENKSLNENFKVKYETEKHKKEKAVAKANEIISLEKAKRSRYISIGAVLISVLIISFLYFIYTKLKLIRKQKKELDNAYEKLEESKKNELAVSNLKALQSQMNPHFIFNALNSVQDLVLLKDIRSSNKYLGKFSDLIRKILLSSKKQFISLEEELEILRLYLDLEKLRFGDDFLIDLQCNISEKQQQEITLPAMFVQPYLENAIKHGLFHKKGKKELFVHFNLKGNTLKCIIEDNGIGQKAAEAFKEKRLHLHTGFSTEAIKERIRLLNETLDKKVELKVEDLYEDDLPAGTKVTLFFPV